jgi:hypothetical protein
MASDESPLDYSGSGQAATKGTKDNLIEQTVTGFRNWLEENLATIPVASNEPEIEVDLHTLLGQFIALKQEVNLLTKATRQTLDQNTTILSDLRENNDPDEASDVAAPFDPKDWFETYDALAQSGRQLKNLINTLDQTDPESEKTICIRPGWFAWIFGAKTIEVKLNQNPTHNPLLNAVKSILAGYELSLSRIDRLLQKHELIGIESIGQLFDPMVMEALETVADPTKRSGEVVEELRRGYKKNDVVLRYALVRVAK